MNSSKYICSGFIRFTGEVIYGGGIQSAEESEIYKKLTRELKDRKRTPKMVEKVPSHFSVHKCFHNFFAYRLVGSGPGTRWKLGFGMSWSNLLSHGSLVVIYIAQICVV